MTREKLAEHREFAARWPSSDVSAFVAHIDAMEEEVRLAAIASKRDLILIDLAIRGDLDTGLLPEGKGPETDPGYLAGWIRDIRAELARVRSRAAFALDETVRPVDGGEG